VNIAAAEEHAASGRPLERQHEPGRGGLSAAALAHQAERLAAPEHEVDPVDRLHRPESPAEDRAAGERKVLGELTRLEDDVAAAHGLGDGSGGRP